jgi:hypothetical protein
MVWNEEFEDLFPLSLLAECPNELGYAEILLQNLGHKRGPALWFTNTILDSQE